MTVHPPNLVFGIFGTRIIKGTGGDMRNVFSIVVVILEFFVQTNFRLDCFLTVLSITDQTSINKLIGTIKIATSAICSS
jgi:hypothetical protein